MSESKMKVTLDKSEYEALVVRSVFLGALIEAASKYPDNSGIPFVAVMEDAEQAIRAKAAETD